MAEITDPNLIAQLEQSQDKINTASRPDKDPATKESENTAGFLATTLTANARQIAEAVKREPGAAAPSLGTEAVRGIWELGARELTPANRQIVEDSQRLVLDAGLTLGTGAAYTPIQLEGYRQALFPQLGDKPETVKAKHERLKAMLVAARIKAGEAAPKIDEAMALLGLSDAPDASPSRLSDEEFTRELRRLIQSGDKEAAERFLLDQKGSYDPKELDTALKARDAAVRTSDGPSVTDYAGQFGDSLVNTAAGIGQGLAAIPDAGAKALGYTLGSVADAIPGVPEEWADSLRNPFTIGGAIEKAVPTPQGWSGWSARLASNLVGGAAGAPARATNAFAERLVGAVPQRVPASPNAFSRKPQVAEDARDLGIRVPASVTGGPVTRAVSAFSAQTPVGAGFANLASNRLADDAAGALGKIASREGVALNPEAAGELATQGALAFRSSSRTAVSRIYDRAAAIAGDAKVVPARTVAALDEQIAQLRENPAGDEALPYLETLRNRLVNDFPNGVTVQGIRNMRTSLRDKFYSAGLRGSDIERRVNEAVQQVGDDLSESLTSAGKSEAATLFREADAQWAKRIDVLDNFIMPIIGKRGEKSGEEVMRSLERAAMTNGNRAKRFVDALPEEEAGTVRASVISALGRSRNGAQNAEGDAFSFDTFLTRWNEMSRSAKNTFFRGQSRSEIDKLARIAAEAKTAGRYANHSNTSGALMTAGTIASGYAGFQTLGATFAGETAIGLLMSSPKVAAAIGRIAAAKTPGAAQSAVKQLSVVATRNPALAEDITALQQRLMESFSRPLAAEEKPAPIEPK